jgi:ribosomal protein S18 acetylase RimI-like enzyme
MTNRDGITTRRADLSRDDDSAAFLALMDYFVADEQGGDGEWAPGIRDRLVAAILARSDMSVYMAYADSDPAPVGFATCIESFSTFWASPALNLHDLMVHPDRRGRGIGRALLSAVERAARESGCCKVTLEVHANNERAKGLYRKVGFIGHGSEASPGTLFWEMPLRD